MAMNFVKWRLPHRNTFSQIANANVKQVDHVNFVTKDSCFYAHPFDSSNNKGLQFLGEIEEGITIKNALIKSREIHRHELVEDRETYFDLANDLIAQLKSGKYDKVVLSRKLEIRSSHVNLDQLFASLCLEYPAAMVYYFRYNDTEWIGASPEVFLQSANNVITSHSLAGTKRTGEDWGQKEVREHSLVTDYISQAFQSNWLSNIQISDVITKSAGPVDHLFCTVSGEVSEKVDLGSLIKNLHPTPAVAGIPKEKAKQWLLRNESHDREYYSGFIGELGKNVNLFVNLRCLKQKDDVISLFVGGGFTIESIAEHEWLETVEKSKTLLSVIEKMGSKLT